MINVDPFTRLRLERGAQHLHHLGPRAVAEFLAEIADAIGGTPCILARLTEYERRISPDMLRAVGGDRFPSRLPRMVPR